MAALFDQLPAQLFSPLAAPGAAVYAEVLLALFREIQRQPLPLTRDLAVQLAQEVLEAAGGGPELEVEPEEGEDPQRARARRVLAYLVDCGWLRIENQRDLSQTYVLLSHAFALLRTLDEIATGAGASPEGLICGIHDLLQHAASDGMAHIRVFEASRLADLYLNVLKELQHNIGRFYEGLAERNRPGAVLEHLFVAYRQDVVDKVYHKLRTTEHASRYRPGILDAIARLKEAGKLEEAARELRKAGAAHTLDEALGRLEETVGAIQDRMDALDALLAAVDDRNRQFYDAAVRKIELMINAGTSTSGQLHRILGAFTAGQADPEEHPGLYDRFALELPGARSLAAPTREGQRFVAAPVASSAPDPEAIEEARGRSTRQIRLALRFSRERVRRFAQALLADRPECRASEIPLGGPEDLPLLIYLRRYGDGSLGYRAVRPAESTWIVKDGVGFEDFVIACR